VGTVVAVVGSLLEEDLIAATATGVVLENLIDATATGVLLDDVIATMLLVLPISSCRWHWQSVVFWNE
jgi:hypothetical protein